MPSTEYRVMKDGKCLYTCYDKRTADKYAKKVSGYIIEKSLLPDV